MDHYKIIEIIEGNNEKLIYSLIDENIFIKNYFKFKLIHYIFIFFKNNEISKYILDKCYDLEESDVNLNKPIHYICENQDEEIIKYIINKKVSLNDMNLNYIKPIDIICERIDLGEISEDILYFLIDNGATYEHLDKKYKHMISNYYKSKIKSYN